MKTLAARATSGFHHISMDVANLEGTAQFWTDLLGLTRWSSGEDPATGAPRIILADSAGRPGSIVELVQDQTGRRGHWGVGGIHHVALGTRDGSTQLMWKRWLMDHGVPVSGPYDRGYFHSIYFRDPEGHVVEIATAGPGYGYDEPMDRLGERFIGADDHGDRMRGSRNERAIHLETHPKPIPTLTPEMELEGIHHITGITHGMDSAHEFYHGALGLSLVKRTVNQDDGQAKHYFWARYDGEEVAPRSALTLFEWPGSTYRARPGQGATRHVAFRADGPAELEQWRQHLQSMGLPVEGPVDRGFTQVLTTRAPDGLRIELATDAPGLSLNSREES